ncbi:MAG: creatininase family protein [Armatimonadetes bacterium]|nr:creatininase family protein [Armatimonadota bacterium]
MKYGELKWTEVEAIDKRKVVLLPIAALEQHGHHMPMLTDTFIATKIAQRAEAAMKDDVLLMPTFWVGSSNHHLAFPGTISLDNSVYTRVLKQILHCLIAAGFHRIFLLNGHGGNVVPADQAIYEVALEREDLTDLWLVMSSYWTLAGSAMTDLPVMETRALTHACEYETSMVLALRPELVDMAKARGPQATFFSDYFVPDASRPSRVHSPRLFHRVSKTGAFGSPELASPEKGAALLQTIADEVVAFLKEFAQWPPLEPG